MNNHSSLYWILTSTLFFSACSHNHPSISLTSISEIDRTTNGQIVIKVENVTEQDQPTVNLHPKNGTEIPLEVASVTDGTIYAQLKNPAVVSGGPVQVSVQVEDQVVAGTTRVYTSPIWKDDGPSFVKMPNNKDRKQDFFSVFIHQLPQESLPSLIIGMRDTTLGTSKELLWYGIDPTTKELVFNNSINNRYKKGSFTSIPTASFGLTKNSMLSYNFNPDIAVMKYVVQATSLVDANNVITSRPTKIQNNSTKFFVDPFSSLQVITDGTDLEVFSFDNKNPYQLISFPPTIAFSNSNTKQIVVRTFPVKEEDLTFRLVILQGKNTLFLFKDYAESALVFDTDLSNRATKKLLDGGISVGSDISIAGLQLADFDQDGYPDLVMALENADGVVKEIGWLPYIGNGNFGNLVRIPLPTVPLDPGSDHRTWLQSVLGMAVGDVNGDGTPDVALLSSQSVVVYLNHSSLSPL